MSTTLIEKDSLKVNRFSGGIEKGLMVQISSKDSHIILSRKDALKLAKVLKKGMKI